MLTSADAVKRQARLTVAVRLSPAGIAEIDATAAAEDRTRSAMIRVLLREAIAARSQQAQTSKVGGRK